MIATENSVGTKIWELASLEGRLRGVFNAGLGGRCAEHVRGGTTESSSALSTEENPDTSNLWKILWMRRAWSAT